MNLDMVRNWTRDDATAHFLRCCGSSKWANLMAEKIPFSTLTELHHEVETSFNQLTENDWLEAFAAHPKIGDVESLKAKFTATRSWSEMEQSTMSFAAQDLLVELAEANKQYEEKNGFIFIVCATGKSPREMLGLLKDRLPNDRQIEIQNAAQEQKKITQLRLEKLLS